MSDTTKIECPYCADRLYCEECGNTGILTIHWQPWERTTEIRLRRLERPFEPELETALISGGGSDWLVLEQKWERRSRWFQRVENEWRYVPLAEGDDDEGT